MTSEKEWHMDVCDWAWDGGAPTLSFDDENCLYVLVLLDYECTVTLERCSLDGEVVTTVLACELAEWNVRTVAQACRSLALGHYLPDPTAYATQLMTAVATKKSA